MISCRDFQIFEITGKDYKKLGFDKGRGMSIGVESVFKTRAKA